MPKEFSVLLPINGTEKEMDFAKTTIPVLASLDPGEILFLTDDDSLDAFLADICKKLDFDRYEIQHIPRSPEWNMQLANVVWHGFERASNEKVILTNVDNRPLPAVMQGYDALDNSAVIMYTGPVRPLVRTPSDRIRAYFAARELKHYGYGISGTYWIRRSAFFELVDIKTYMDINNGIDTTILDQFYKHPEYKIIKSDDYIIQSLDYENPDMPWRQFQFGIYFYTHRFDLQIGSRSIFKLFDRRHPLLYLIRFALKRQHRHMISGYLWACRNKNHGIVKLAEDSKTYDHFVSHASGNVMSQIKDWGKVGRIGTGFKVT